MFERFASSFRCDSREGDRRGWGDDRSLGISGYRELTEQFSGCSFNDGLYRIHSADTAAVGQPLAAAAFPELAPRISVFGFDWLGTQAALDFGRVSDGEPQVLLLEPGTGEALEVPMDIARFHDEELVDSPEAALASDFFAEWQAANPSSAPLSLGQCVGYKAPLFLGGSDTLDNLEVCDFEVYWDLFGQLRRSAEHAPRGTRIARVSRGSS